MSDPPKLSEELLNVGWKVVYSKRKKKWYYFNKKTNMSLWSMPVSMNICFLLAAYAS